MDRKKLIRNTILVVLIFTVLIVFVTSNITWEMFQDVVHTMEYRYLYIAIGIILLYVTMHFASLYNVLRIYTKQITFIDAYHIATCAHFYNGVTPFSAGGQPFQIYYMGKRGLTLDESTGVIIMNFIVYQLVIFALSVVSIGLLWSNLAEKVSNFSYIVMLGFTANSTIFLFLILFSRSRTFKRGILGVLFGILRALPFFKKRASRWEISANQFVEDFQEAMSRFRGNYGKLAKSVFYRGVGMLVFFSLPYFVFRALGVEIDLNHIYTFIGFAAFAHIFYTFIPLPGSSGGAEFAFYTLYATIGTLSSLHNKEHILLLGLLLWRLIAYYMSMLIGFVSTMILENSKI